MHSVCLWVISKELHLFLELRVNASLSELVGSMFAPITDGSASGSVRQVSTARAKSAPPSQFDRLGRRNSNLTRQDPASTRSCHQPDQPFTNIGRITISSYTSICSHDFSIFVAVIQCIGGRTGACWPEHYKELSWTLSKFNKYRREMTSDIIIQIIIIKRLATMTINNNNNPWDLL